MGYDLNVVYGFPGYDEAERLDKEIDAAVGKESWASGFGFGERDLSYEFESGLDATDALLRVRERLSSLGIGHRAEVNRRVG